MCLGQLLVTVLTPMDLRSLKTESRPVELAAQLATALAPNVRASFEEWLASVPAGAVPEDLAAGDKIEIKTEQAEQDAAAAVAGAQAAAPAAFASPALEAAVAAAAIPKARAARARVELPHPRPRQRADTVDPEDDERSRSARSNPDISAVGSCRSANRGMEGRARGMSRDP